MTERDKDAHLWHDSFDKAMGALWVARAVAKREGYALGVHGSMARDLDLIAAPWTEKACDADELIEHLCRALDATLFETDQKPEHKPHGRKAWSLHLLGLGLYLDVSVMPKVSK